MKSSTENLLKGTRLMGKHVACAWYNYWGNWGQPGRSEKFIVESVFCIFVCVWGGSFDCRIISKSSYGEHVWFVWYVKMQLVTLPTGSTR